MCELCPVTAGQLVRQETGVGGNRTVLIIRGVVQLVRTLLSDRYNDVSDLEISNLTQITSGRPVTVPSTFPAFPKAPVRSSGVP